MKYFIPLVILHLSMVFGFSQAGLKDLSTEIIQNNTFLKAINAEIERQQLGNKTGIYPDNPELEFSYFIGSPTEIGNRRDFSLSQSFDFPGSYGIKKDIAKLRNDQLEYLYDQHKSQLIHDIISKIVDFDYLNTRMLELRSRSAHFQEIHDAFQFKLEKGEATLIDLNKSRLNLLTLNKEIDIIEVNKSMLEAELRALNGDKPLNLDTYSFKLMSLPRDFEIWFSEIRIKIPELKWLEMEMGISEKETSLTRKLNLPGFTAAYISEGVAGETFRGLSLGMDIPIWENKGKLAQSKAKTASLKSRYDHQQMYFMTLLKKHYQTAKVMERNLTEFLEEFENLNDLKVLNRSLELGNITLVDYLLELGFFYDSKDLILEMQYQMNQEKSELFTYELLD